MTKSEIPAMPAFFDRYINLAEDIDLVSALIKTASFDSLIPVQTLEALGDQRYAPDKWTVRDILQHMIDTERILSYRAMRIARADQTPLPSFEEALYADHAHANRRTVADLLDELSLVRRANILLFSNMDAEMLLRSGTCSNQLISALALGFVVVGHPMHHANILRERYVPLLT